MLYENIKTEIKDGVLTLTINREKALNALNQLTFKELHYFFATDAPTMTYLKGIIVTGAGDKAFVAGADIKEFLSLDQQSAMALSKFGQDTFFLIERFPKPVVAAINGFALGGGCELAMACHLRVASERAKFGQPEVNLGIIPGYGGTQRLVQYVGKTKAMELLLTADLIDAAEAHRLGLVNQVVSAGQEVVKATELIEKIASKGPIAIAQSIASVNAFFEKTVDGFDFEVKSFGKTSESDDFKEGAAAFIEKRKATFRNQ